MKHVAARHLQVMLLLKIVLLVMDESIETSFWRQPIIFPVPISRSGHHHPELYQTPVVHPRRLAPGISNP
jgi:hypothetical protein